MNPKFVSGRNNLAVTIMMPFDCPNNCPFCESKKEYARNRPSLDNVVNAIKHIFRDNNTLDIPEVVITGGEPMANILALCKIINVIPSDKDVYINTTLINKNFEAFVALVNTHPQIKGINVSRHCTTYKEDCKILHGIVADNEISRIKKPVRINCVLNDRSRSFFRDVIARWENMGVELSFREDFNEMTEEELHDPYSHSLPYVATVNEYIGHTQCKVCDTTTFRSERGMVIRYHKGIKNTLVYLGNGIGNNTWEINDIVVRQDGEVFCDWDFTNKTLLPTNLLHDNRKEIMQRSVERIVDIAPTPCHTCGGGYSGCGGGVDYTPRFSCGGGCSSCGGGGSYSYTTSCGGGCSSCG
jgi:molybdenum cofactor biosynthesis enzyme MoaA